MLLFEQLESLIVLGAVASLAAALVLLSLLDSRRLSYFISFGDSVASSSDLAGFGASVSVTDSSLQQESLKTVR